MATYESQLEQIKRQQEEAKLSRSQIEQQKRQIEQNRLSITQPSKRQAFTERKTRESQRKYLREELPKASQSISEYENQLGNYENQLDSAKNQLEKAQELQRLYDKAESLALKYQQTGDARILWSASLQFGKNPDVWKYFNDYRKGLNVQRPQYDDSGISTPPTIKPIYDSSGKVIGYDDPFSGESRLPTPVEKITGLPIQPTRIGQDYPLYEFQAPKYELPKSITDKQTDFVDNVKVKLRQLPSAVKDKLGYYSRGLLRVGIEQQLKGGLLLGRNQKYKIPIKGNIAAEKELIKYDKALQSFTGASYYQAREAELVGLTLALPYIGIGTKIALVLNSKGIIDLAKPTVKNSTKVAKFGEIALSVGTAALGGAALGAAGKFTEDAAMAAGYQILSKVLKGSGKAGSQVLRNVAGLSLVSLGKLSKAAIETYFKTTMIQTGVTGIKALKGKDYRKTSLLGSELIGGAAGFFPGSVIGRKGFDLSALVTGKYVSTRPELFQKQVTVKKQPSAVQAEVLTESGNIIAYRRGPIQTGQKFEPRLDKYLSSSIKEPTKSIFFRFEETKGVKGNPIEPALSVPAFVQPTPYREMFVSNLKAEKGNKFRRLINSIAKTPIMNDILAVGRARTKPIDARLREKLIKEYATTGKLSKETQRELLKADSLISDKLREYSYAEEQEAVFRNVVKLSKNTKLGFTRDSSGKLIPVIYEKGTLKPRLSVLRKKKIITEQDAKYVQRQYNMWQKFGKEYVLPKEHSLVHASEVSKNIRKLVNAYSEFHPYLIKKYGSLDKAIKQLELGAKFHDIGKVSESSAEFGTPHGQKIYNIWKEGLLPREAQNIKKGIAKAIKTHETLDPRKFNYRLTSIIGGISPEQRILSTADRLDLARYGIKIDPNRLPLRDALTRLNIKQLNVKAPKEAEKESYKYKKQDKFLSLMYEDKKYKKTSTYRKPYTTPNYLTSSKYKEPKNYKKPYSPNNYLTYSKYQSVKKPYNSYKPYKNPKVPYTPYKQPKRPIIVRNLLVGPESKGRKRRSKQKKGRTGYKTLPTVFELITFGKAKSKTAKKRITGAEVFRFI